MCLYHSRYIRYLRLVSINESILYNIHTRKAVGGPQDVLRSMGGGPQNAYRGSTVEKGWEPLVYCIIFITYIELPF